MGIFCDVRLDNVQGVFSPGQMITGNIQLTLDERILIKAFAMKFSGYAATRWEKPIPPKKKNDKQVTNGEVQEKPIVYYTNREDYLSTINYLNGSEEAIPHIVEPGSYAYSFGVRLPDKCASTTESAIGHIRYEMDVFLVYPEHKHSCFARTIHVTKPLDLRAYPHLLEPADIGNSEKISRTKFWQHPLQLQINTPQTGYVPGERISVYVKLHNSGHVVLTDLFYKINMIGTYTGYRKKEKLKTTVAKTLLFATSHSLFGQNGNVVEHLESLQLPTAAPTLSSTDCKCMQLNYEVEVTVNTKSDKRGISAQIPIFVGTISLHDKIQPREPTAPQSRDMAAGGNIMMASIEDLSAAERDATAPPLEPSTMGEAADLSVSMSSLASSSFREADYMSAMKVKKNSKHSMNGDEANFKPKYLYYNMDGGIGDGIQEAVVSSTSNEIEKVPL